jgi:hypothetical protein
MASGAFIHAGFNVMKTLGRPIPTGRRMRLAGTKDGGLAYTE